MIIDKTETTIGKTEFKQHVDVECKYNELLLVKELHRSNLHVQL